ncbi:S-type anion channel SLAH3 [Acorus calamus]|uniref:S-type anion channel SLAH3 n=1 Tax=Acorus calamus TaxID=4465 RepID=A0AAV9CDD1_ACOCL|nr:S-type anion channel SLAH3 [Acorus calamus]
MENRNSSGSSVQVSCELPTILHYVTSKKVAGFDIGDSGSSSCQDNLALPTEDRAPDIVCGKEMESIALQGQADSEAISSSKSVVTIEPHHSHKISISLPSSPSHYLGDIGGTNSVGRQPVTSAYVHFPQAMHDKFHSQTMQTGTAHEKVACEVRFQDHLEQQPRNPRLDRLKDKRFDSFKTWSGKLERQLSNLRGKPLEEEPEENEIQNTEIEALPVHRFFDALEGPELDTLKPSEELALPEDKQWPFLLRFPISSFGICLGVSSQAILWKTLATSPSTEFLHVSLDVNLVLWCISVALTAIVSFIYSLKVIFFFETVRREYYHPIRVNFFFAPWIAYLFLGLGLPPSIPIKLHAALWYSLMTPIFCLELKIYGQWMSGGQRRLSKVANPSNHLAIVGNFVGALLGASMGLKEGPIFFFAVGLAHYTVLFVTLYQRLPTNATLPKELHPVFFLFVAAPSVASMAWAKINGEFGYGARMAYFIALFLYFSLAVRINFFRGFKFSLAWWAYTFPMTGASIATIRYSMEVKNPVTQSLSVMLSAISTLTVTALLVATILHAFVFRDLFPNDVSIAITDRKIKSNKKHSHLRSTSSDAKNIEEDSLSISIHN